MKILIADDDAVSRLLMKRILERDGYDVVAVQNGREAADELATRDCPRLALIDWLMPELDGLGVCREVRGRNNAAYTYITLLTSKQATEDVVAGLQAGADDYLTKPCNPEELKARLRTGVRILELEDRLVEAHDQMRFRADHDGLTSLWNHGAILNAFDLELQRARRENSNLSMLMCDLDRFKSVNDTYGHSVGDDVLRETANRLTAAVRPYDSVGRYGGEEFLIVLVGCDGDMAQRRAEEIREAIAGQPFATSHGPLSVTISIGSLTTADWSNDLSAGYLLNEADQALYRAKASGRNRVCVQHPMPSLLHSVPSR